MTALFEISENSSENICGKVQPIKVVTKWTLCVHFIVLYYSPREGVGCGL